jgi:hypothetical protein
MIRISDSVVADWNVFIWKHDGKLVEQVQAYLFNGMVLIMDIEDFFGISDDEPW